MSKGQKARGRGRVRISLAMIVKNEARFITDCLESVRDAVDEMVVVDTGSTDGTPELARRAGARVFHFEWCDDFAAARNASIEHARGEWVLWLDADERMAPGGGRALRQAIQRNDFDCGMLAVHHASSTDASIEDVMSGRSRISAPYIQAKLLRRTPDLRFEGAVHEGPRTWLQSRRDRIQPVPVHLVHLGFADEMIQARKKADRNIRLLEQRAVQEPRNWGVWGYLASEYLGKNDPERAREAVETGWTLFQEDPELNWDNPVHLAVQRARLQLFGGELAGVLETVRYLDARLGPVPRQPQLDLLEGGALMALAQQAQTLDERQAQLRSAAQAYQSAISKDGLVFATTYNQAPTPVAWKGLGTAALLLGDPGAALECYEAALESGEDRDAQLGKAEALAEADRPAEALAVAEPLADGRPDGWLIAAEVAEWRGQLAEFGALLRGARERIGQGYAQLHRWDDHAGAHSRLLAYLGQPQAAPGAVGAACGLLAGQEPGRWPIEPDPRAWRTIRVLLRNLVLVGRNDLVERLKSVPATDVLPGIDVLAWEALDKVPAGVGGAL